MKYLIQSSGEQNSLGFEWYPGNSNRNSPYQEDNVKIQTAQAQKPKRK